MLHARNQASHCQHWSRGAALHVTVINGDLSFIRQPLLLGHYRSLRLTGTEFVMNRLVGGAMDDSLKVGLYPEPPGTHQVFINTRTDPENPGRRRGRKP